MTVGISGFVPPCSVGIIEGIGYRDFLLKDKLIPFIFTYCKDYINYAFTGLHLQAMNERLDKYLLKFLNEMILNEPILDKKIAELTETERRTLLRGLTVYLCIFYMKLIQQSIYMDDNNVVCIREDKVPKFKQYFEETLPAYQRGDIQWRRIMKQLKRRQEMNRRVRYVPFLFNLEFSYDFIVLLLCF